MQTGRAEAESAAAEGTSTTAQKRSTAADVDFDSPEWEVEADSLLQWSKQLDYEDYVANWLSLGTSAAPRRPMNLADEELEATMGTGTTLQGTEFAGIQYAAAQAQMYSQYLVSEPSSPDPSLGQLTGSRGGGTSRSRHALSHRYGGTGTGYGAGGADDYRRGYGSGAGAGGSEYGMDYEDHGGYGYGGYGGEVDGSRPFNSPHSLVDRVAQDMMDAALDVDALEVGGESHRDHEDADGDYLSDMLDH